jgi:hypothetical protein
VGELCIGEKSRAVQNYFPEAHRTRLLGTTLITGPPRLFLLHFMGMFLLFRSWATNKMHGPVDREEAVSNERMVSGRSRTRRGCTATFPQKQSPAKPQFNWNVSIQVQASSVHTTTILRIFEMFQNISVTALLKLLKVVIVGVKHYHTR